MTSDGWIDLEDFRCLENLSEISVGSRACNDGEDNNIDGLRDADDPDCMSGFQLTEEAIVEETCIDGDDNDDDGWIDRSRPRLRAWSP